jgi:hypothetical protein
MTTGDAYAGVRARMNALLLAPTFLYRSERGVPETASGNGFWAYTSSEIAARRAGHGVRSAAGPGDGLATDVFYR